MTRYCNKCFSKKTCNKLSVTTDRSSTSQAEESDDEEEKSGSDASDNEERNDNSSSDRENKNEANDSSDEDKKSKSKSGSDDDEDDEEESEESEEDEKDKKKGKVGKPKEARKKQEVKATNKKGSTRTGPCIECKKRVPGPLNPTPGKSRSTSYILYFYRFNNFYLVDYSWRLHPDVDYELHPKTGFVCENCYKRIRHRNSKAADNKVKASAADSFLGTEEEKFSSKSNGDTSNGNTKRQKVDRVTSGPIETMVLPAPISCPGNVISSVILDLKPHIKSDKFSYTSSEKCMITINTQKQSDAELLLRPDQSNHIQMLHLLNDVLQMRGFYPTSIIKHDLELFHHKLTDELTMTLQSQQKKDQSESIKNTSEHQDTTNTIVTSGATDDTLNKKIADFVATFKNLEQVSDIVGRDIVNIKTPSLTSNHEEDAFRDSVINSYSRANNLIHELVEKKKQVENQLNIGNIVQLQSMSKIFTNVYEGGARIGTMLDKIDYREKKGLNLAERISELQAPQCIRQASGLVSVEAFTSKINQISSLEPQLVKRMQDTNMAALKFFQAMLNENVVMTDYCKNLTELFGMVNVDFKAIDKAMSNISSQVGEYQEISKNLELTLSTQRDEATIALWSVKKISILDVLELLSSIKRYDAVKTLNRKWKEEYPTLSTFLSKSSNYWKAKSIMPHFSESDKGDNKELYDSLINRDTENRAKLDSLIEFEMQHIITNCLFRLPFNCQSSDSVFMNAFCSIHKSQPKFVNFTQDQLISSLEVFITAQDYESLKGYYSRELDLDSIDTITSRLNAEINSNIRVGASSAENEQVDSAASTAKVNTVASVVYNDTVSVLEHASLLTCDSGLLQQGFSFSSSSAWNEIEPEFEFRNQNNYKKRYNNIEKNLMLYPVTAESGNACLLLSHLISTVPMTGQYQRIFSPPTTDRISSRSKFDTDYAEINPPIHVSVNSGALVNSYPISIGYESTRLQHSIGIDELRNNDDTISLEDAITSIGRILRTISIMINQYGLIPSNFYQDVTERDSKESINKQSISIRFDAGNKFDNPYLMVYDWLNGFRVATEEQRRKRLVSFFYVTLCYAYDLKVDGQLRLDIETIVNDLLFTPYNSYVLSPVHDNVRELLEKVDTNDARYTTIKELLDLNVFSMKISAIYRVITSDEYDSFYTSNDWTPTVAKSDITPDQADINSKLSSIHKCERDFFDGAKTHHILISKFTDEDDDDSVPSKLVIYSKN